MNLGTWYSNTLIIKGRMMANNRIIDVKLFVRG